MSQGEDTVIIASRKVGRGAGLLAAASVAAVLTVAGHAHAGQRVKPSSHGVAVSCDSETQYGCASGQCEKDPDPIHLSVAFDSKKGSLEVCFPSVCATGKATVETEANVVRAIAVVRPAPGHPPSIGPTPVWFSIDQQNLQFIAAWGNAAGIVINTGNCKKR